MYTLLLSALAYIIPFWHPALWPLIFLFPALLIITRSKKVTPTHALVWGFIISIGHILPVAQALYTMAQGPACFRLIPGIILIGYIAIYIAFWFLVLHHLKNNLVWIGTFWLFMISLDRAIMLPLNGNLEGSLFMNPLTILPPYLLTLLPHLGMACLLGAYSITSSTIGLWFCKKISASILVLSLIPWIVSMGLVQKYETNFPYKRIGYLPIMAPKNSDSSSLFLSEIAYIQESHPHITTIITPESSCHEPPTLDYPVHLIMGSFENYQTIRSNIACWLYKGKTQVFRKTHTMIFGEILPTWLDNGFFNNLIFATALPILKGNNQRPAWHLSNDVTLVPYICSELFFSHSPQDRFNDPIVAICNDWWFTMPHFKHLMARAARLRAIQWHRPIVYVSYFYGLFFDQFGTTYQLERL